MANIEEPYWSYREVLDWWSQAGIEEQAALEQLLRAIGEGKLRAIGRKYEWRDGIPASRPGNMETIPYQEALDLVPILGTYGELHLFSEVAEYPMYYDDIRVVNITSVRNSTVRLPQVC